MKVVFPTCCGVDVHKSFLVATIIKTPKESLQPSYQKKRFSTFNSDLNRFADWLHENDCLDVCMESTGKYWVPVFNILEKRGIRVTIANPKWVKAVKGNKDDTKDSKWIGDLFRIGLVKSSFIPAKDIRILRELTRYRYKLTSMKSSEKNRFQNAFTVCNVALDSVVSDMFGKSATAITDYLTSDVEFDVLSEEEIRYYVDKYQPMDKAGAYGVQEWIGYIGVKSISGSFYNIMGLPIQKLYGELKKL